MRILLTAAAGCALAGLLGAGAPLRADEDCDSVVTALEEAISIATKNLEQTVSELQKIMSEPANEQKKASVKNIACSATGELLGTARASHALAAVVDEAKRCAESGEQKVILTALCGHGHFDMTAYERYLSGDMTDYDLPQDRIDAAIADLPVVPGA